ncbi:MAG: hypothetical protein KGQ75_11825, partial [Sphingomonadales bacterium]|nr:hypothetical protein [Sphingomonadales bacterium]
LTLSGARPGQGQREEVGNFQMSLLGHFTPPSTVLPRDGAPALVVAILHERMDLMVRLRERL